MLSQAARDQRRVERARGSEGEVVAVADQVATHDRQVDIEDDAGMALAEIVEQARGRWDVMDATVIHRVGELKPGDNIVLVVVASAHRGDAFAACEFIMDFLKTRAPFWKKERTADGDRWVDSRESDDAAARRWWEQGTPPS